MRKSVCVSVFEQRTGTPEIHNDLCLILCDDMYCMWWHLKARTRLLFFRCKSDAVAVVVVVAADVRVEEALCIVEHICDKIVHTRESHRSNTFSIALFRSMFASPLVRWLFRSRLVMVVNIANSVRRTLIGLCASAYYAHIRSEFPS